MMSAKRVILANGSRLLREMLHRAIEKADQLEVVQEVPDWEELPAALEAFHPAWVIVTQPYKGHDHLCADRCMEKYPSVRFMFLSVVQNRITMKWQMSHEQEYADLSLGDLIDLLERDRQQT